MDRTIRMIGRGSGKLILFGEHAVVYGYPAIVAGLPRGANASVSASERFSLTLVNGRTGEKIVQAGPNDGSKLGEAFDAILQEIGIPLTVAVHVTLDIPLGVGLGSSAAMATAVARALSSFAGVDESLTPIERAVEAAEAIFHGAPSGIDQAAALSGGVFRFTRHPDGMKKIESLILEPVRIAVCQAGPAADTEAMVARVAALKESQPAMVDGLFSVIASLVEQAMPALATGDWSKVGELLNANHGALVALGVSSPELDNACQLARNAGAFGAKLTGAGGGGCVMALANEHCEDVIAAWKAAGLDAFEVTIP